MLLTDWMMPGVDGPELCRRVRHELNRPYVYIVLITGLGNTTQVLEGMSAGADDYLTKPVDPFSVQTRLVAAERVTMLHREVAAFRAQLEVANEQLRGLSLTDPLTMLGNRRRMDQDLAAMHARALRSGRPFGVVLFDIDHFKLYNDRYGHLAGDETLRRVAQCLDQTVRRGERVYRYGGEEFLLLLSDATVDGTASAAWRCLRAIASTAMPHQARPTPPAVVTLSGGTSWWSPVSALSVPDLLRRADEALYEAKSSGRNRVHPAPDPDGARVGNPTPRPAASRP